MCSKSKWIFVLMATAFCVLGATVSRAADYHVSQNHASASDANDGMSEASPWKTLQHAANVVQPGDIVHVWDGDYDERVQITTSGHAGAKIVFRAETTNVTVLHGFIIQADGIRIEGFRITHNPNGRWLGGGIWLSGHYIDIVDNYFYDITGAGIQPSWHPLDYWNNIYVAGNTIVSCGKGIVVSGNSWVVENNEIEHIVYHDEDADYTRFFGTNLVLRNNFLHGTRQSEIGPSHTDSFQTFNNNGEVAQNVVIENNMCLDFVHQGIMAGASTVDQSHDGIVVRNNIFANNQPWGICAMGVLNLSVLNNTFFNSTGYGAGFRYGSTGVVKNNIFVDIPLPYFIGSGETPAASYESAYNMIFDHGRSPEPGSRSDYLNTDPRFNNPGNLLGPDGIPWTEDDGLRPGANSPALGAGEKGEDVGAYAFTPDMNTPPVMQVIGPKTIQAGRRLTFVVSASDADGDPLSYSAGSLSGSLSLDGEMLRWHPDTLPGNAVFNEATATFTWDTSNADVGDHMVVFTVTDGGTPAYVDSETVTIHVDGDEIPVPPTVGQPTAQATGPRSIRVAWPAVAGEHNVVRYHIYRNGGAAAVGTSTGTAYADTGLTPATTYTYRIKAENDSGALSVDFSNEARATTQTDTSPDPILQVAPDTSVTFGDVQVGQSRDVVFTVSNAGGGTLTGAAIVPGGLGLSIVGPSNWSLGAGAQTVVTVRYAPSAQGTLNAEVAFQGPVNQQVTVTGRAVSGGGDDNDDPVLTVSPSVSVDYGDVEVGEFKDINFTVRNTGGGTLTGSVTTPEGIGLSIIGDTNWSLGADAQTTITVRYAPLSEGSLNAVVTFQGPENKQVTVTGRGVESKDIGDIVDDKLNCFINTLI